MSSRLLPQPRLQHGHEKSVGAIAPGKQPQHAALCLRTIITANDILPDIADFSDFQFRRLGQKDDPWADMAHHAADIGTLETALRAWERD